MCPIPPQGCDREEHSSFLHGLHPIFLGPFSPDPPHALDRLREWTGAPGAEPNQPDSTAETVGEIVIRGPLVSAHSTFFATLAYVPSADLPRYARREVLFCSTVPGGIYDENTISTPTTR